MRFLVPKPSSIPLAARLGTWNLITRDEKASVARTAPGGTALARLPVGEELGVGAALGDEVVVAAEFGDAALVDHGDSVAAL